MSRNQLAVDILGVIVSDQGKHDKEKSTKQYSEEELTERITPYLAHADELEDIVLSREDYEYLLKKLEAEPEPNPKLKKLLERKSPWK